MPICIVFAHPDTSSLSFKIYRELTELLKSEGHKIFCQDLYGDSFNPVMPLDELKRRMSLDPLVTRYSKELTESEGLIIIHPDWWAGAPAILKGWVDRVFRPGTAYDEIRNSEEDEKEFFPLLAGKKAAVIALSYRDVNPDGLRIFWEDTVLGWCGIRDFKFYHLKNLEKMDWEDVEDCKRNFIHSIQMTLSRLI